MSTVDPETAERELERFCERMGLEVELDDLDPDDKKNLETAQRRLRKAICEGHLTVDGEGVATFQPSQDDNAPELVFDEPTGAVFMAMDGYKKDFNVAKLYALLAEWTGQPKTYFARMKNRDLRICRTMAELFLG